MTPSCESALPGSLQHTVQEVSQTPFRRIKWKHSTNQKIFQIESRGGKAIAVVCDHNKDEDIEEVFQQIQKEQGRLDLLVNNAYSAVPILQNNIGTPFWEMPGTMWDDNNGAGLR